MATALQMNLTFPTTPAKLYAMFQNETYLQMKCALSENGTFAIAQKSNEAQIVINRQFTDIPESFRKFVGTALDISETQIWQQDSSEKFHASVKIVVHDKPVQLDGTFTLTPHLDGAVLEIDAQVQVMIPLFGGMAEGIIKEHMQGLLEDERAIALQWLEIQA